uniref:Protein kinase domain-containing protein n=1 Tax=Rhabditophanes sp. KR3021 TaxID=114890 RepID=A0AC35UGJ9_9BILA
METYNEGQQILADEFEEVDDNCVVCEEDSNVYDYHFSSDENEEFDEYEEQIMDEQVANIMPITSNRFQTNLFVAEMTSGSSVVNNPEGIALVIGCSDEEEEANYNLVNIANNFNGEMDFNEADILQIEPNCFHTNMLTNEFIQTTAQSPVSSFLGHSPFGHNDIMLGYDNSDLFNQQNIASYIPDLGFQRIEDNYDTFTIAKPPKIIEGYLFGSVLGQGSYAKVKEVVHESMLVRRAVKIIKDKTLRKIPNGSANVASEIKIMEIIGRHPHSVELFDVFRINEKQKIYMIMEYCVTSLQQMLDSTSTKNFPQFQSQHYFAQLISGIEYLHLNHIIHKDIKPANLLLAVNGFLKISDFGVAEVIPEDRRDGINDWC